MRVLSVVRNALLLGLLATAPGIPAFGEPPPPTPPKKGYDPAAATDAALAAFQKGDAKALEVLSFGRVDPWVVATMLLERGESNAATALAAVAPRPDTKALPTHVAEHRVGPKDRLLRDAVQVSADALAAGRTGEAIAACEAALPDAKGTLRIHLLHARALARMKADQHAEAAGDFALAGDEAEAMGWFKRAATMRDAAGLRWLEVGESAKAQAEFEKEVALDEKRQVPEHLALSLSRLAMVNARAGNLTRAIALGERAIPLAERAGDHGTLLVLLNNHGAALRAEGRARESLALHDRAGLVAKEVGDQSSAARSAQLRGLALRDLGDVQGALEATRVALDVLLALDSRARVVEARCQLSYLQRRLGDRRAARESAVKALSEAEALHDEAVLAQGWLCMADALLTDGAPSEAMAMLERARAVHLRRGPAGDLVCTLGKMTVAHLRLRENSKALSVGTDAVVLARAQGNSQELATSLYALAQVHSALGEPDRAIQVAEQALSLNERLGNAPGVADARALIGRARVALGDATGGLALLERARSDLEKVGDLRRLAGTEAAIGDVYLNRGAWQPATNHHERALTLFQGLGDSSRIARQLVALGGIWRSRGEVGRSLAYQDAAEDLLSKLPDGYEAAVLRADLAWIWEFLGEPERALALRRRSAEGFAVAGTPADAAIEWSAVAAIQAGLGSVEAALAEAARISSLLESVDDPMKRALILGRLADVQALAGRLPTALELVRQAASLLEQQTDPLPLAFAHHRGAGVLLGMERLEDALVFATKARDLFARSGRPDLEGGAEAYRAQAMLGLGRSSDALSAARRSILLVERSTRGLADEELARGWSRRSGLPCAVGLAAAAAVRSPADALWFVESVRGRALIELFAVRDTLRDAMLSPALRDAAVEARAHRTAAGEAMRRATGRADAAAFEAAREASDRADQELAQVEARAQREAKWALALVPQRPVTLEEIQRGLREGEALVLYGNTISQVIAVVVERGGGRLVALAPSEEVRAACAALAAEVPGTDTSHGEEALRKLVLAPLGLGKSVKRLIVSPDDALAFIPFALLDREREVVAVPSATVMGLLRSEPRRSGEGVLALGDPSYRAAGESVPVAHLRSGTLSLPIPMSGDEAREVGVGDESAVLLRAQATIPALREQLARKRWRSVHLACHGLLHADRPALSGLALTPVGDDDGVLRVLDVFRLKVDADLVVLSACETARGEVLRGEGILGLTRAFLYAGAPRVIASLWKVDDAATRALMKTFYARWAEGASPPAALRDAQAFVAAQPAWKHPHYWAAWTLWGLPD